MTGFGITGLILPSSIHQTWISGTGEGSAWSEVANTRMVSKSWRTAIKKSMSWALFTGLVLRLVNGRLEK